MVLRVFIAENQTHEINVDSWETSQVILATSLKEVIEDENSWFEISCN